jgi:hypothetical protein
LSVASAVGIYARARYCTTRTAAAGASVVSILADAVPSIVAAERIVGDYLSVASAIGIYARAWYCTTRTAAASTIIVSILAERIPSSVAAERIVGDYLSVAWIAGVDSGWRCYTSTGA